MTLLSNLASLDSSSVTHRYDRRDRFVLVDGVSVTNRTVRDWTTGLTIELDAVGEALLGAIAAPDSPTVGELSDALEVKYGLGRSEAFVRTIGYLDALDQSAVLKKIQGPSVASAAAVHLRTRGLSLFLVDWVAAARGGRTDRYSPTLAGLARAVLRTQWLIPALGIALGSGVLVAVGVSLGFDRVSSSGQAQVVIASPLLVGALHVVLFWVHEAGHLVTARHLSQATQPRYVVARGRKLGVVRGRGAPKTEIAVSCAGPIAAAVAAFAVALFFAANLDAGSAYDHLLTSVAVFLGIGHLLSLVPLASDGSNVVRSIRELRSQDGDSVASRVDR